MAFKKDANGNIVQVDDTSNILSADQIKANAVYVAARNVNPSETDKIVNAAKGNLSSPGVIASLAKLGVDPQSPLAKNITGIDALTKEQRTANQNAAAMQRQKDDFNNSLKGKLWSAVKGIARGTVLLGSSAYEAVNAGYRTTVQNIQQQGVVSGLTSFINPFKSDEQLRADNQSFLSQTKIGQAVLQAENKKGYKFQYGEGFFPSEDTGLGLAARKASNATAHIDIKDADGNVVAQRPRTLFSDLPSYILTNGHPDGVVGSVIGLAADFGASWYLDPINARAKAAQVAKEAAKAARTTAGLSESAKIADQVASANAEAKRLEEARNEFLKADAQFNKAAANTASVKADEAKAAYNGRREDVIAATNSVKNQYNKYNDALVRNDNIKNEVQNITQQISDIDAISKAPNRLSRAQAELNRANAALEEGKKTVASGQYPEWFIGIPKLEAAVTQAQQKVADLTNLVGNATLPDAAKLDELKVSLAQAKLRLKYSTQEVSQMAKDFDSAKKAARIAKAAEAGKLTEYADRAKKARTAQQIIDDAAMTREDKLKALADALERNSQVKNIDTNGVDFTALSNFLTDGHGARAIERLAEMTDWKQILRATKFRVTMEQAKDIAAATSKEEVLTKLAPFIDNADLTRGVFKPGVLERTGEKVLERTRFATPFANKLVGVGAAVAHRMPFHAQVAAFGEGFGDGIVAQADALKKYVFNPAKRSYTTTVRGGTLLNIHDTDALVHYMDDFATAAKLDKSVADNLLERIANAKSASERGYIATTGLMDEVVKKYAETLSPESRKQLEAAAKVFKSSNNEASSWWATRHASGADIEFITVNGQRVNLHGPHLEAELLNSSVYMPPADDVLRLISKLQKYAKTGTLTQVGDALINDFWKKMQLVRPAYIIRNLAEEQLRVFGTGHISFFNNPLMATAMWLGAKDGNKFQKVLYSMDKYTHNVFGKDFASGDEVADFLDETVAHDAANSYIELMAGKSGAFSDRGIRTLTLKNVTAVQPGHPRFWDGITNQIRILNSDEFASVVAGRTYPEIKAAIDKGATREDAVIDYFFSGNGRKALDKLASSHSEDVQRWLSTRDGVKEYLYTGKAMQNGRLVDASVYSRVGEVTAGNNNLRQLIAFGKTKVGTAELRVPTAADGARNSLANAKALKESKKALLDEQQLFAKTLKNTFGDVAKHSPDMLVNIPDKNVDVLTAGKRGMQALRNATDGFFDLATNLSHNVSMGPEFRQAYWDAINEVSGALDAKAAAKLREIAAQSVTPLTRNGINFGQSHPVLKALENVKDGGVLSLEDAHKYADSVARKAVKELFYQANEKRLIFHQLRLIGPFMNAWENTIRAWGEIGARNPYQVYKLAKSIDWLEKPESSALYKATDLADTYDPNQGFFFTDASSGQRMFWIPFAGTIMSKLAGVPADANFGSNPIAFSANPMSFNFALGAGSILPGVGPGVTIPLSMIDSFNKGFIDNLPLPIQQWLFPFGKLDTSKGPLAAVLPTNWNRILGGFTGEDSTYNNTFKPIMGYIASGANYNLDDPDQQAALIQKTDTFARWFSIMRGVVGLFSPASLQSQGLAHDKNGDVTTQVALYNDFQNILKENNGDYNTAVSDFLDLYGANAVFAIISGTSGSGPDNWDAYQFLKAYPDVAAKYKDVWGYVYPGGGFAQEMHKWNLVNKNKTKLSPEEILTKANNLRYYAAKDSILRMVDANQLDKKGYQQALNNLKQSFNGGPEASYDPSKFSRDMSQMRALVADERFSDAPAIVALRDYIYLRDTALAKIGRNPSQNLKGTGPDSMWAKGWLSDQVLWLLKEHPDFYKMYYQFFAKELEG